MKKVWITGATGYIGGAIAIELHKRGYEVYGVDRVFRSHLDSYYRGLIVADFASQIGMAAMLKVEPDVIIHCASSIMVDDSVKNPLDYYENNVSKTTMLIRCMRDFLPNTLLMFSSTGTVYEQGLYLKEDSPKSPMSPYSKSKYMVEQILESCKQAHNLKYCCFRYFNACGAIDDKHGQQPTSDHIFAKLLIAMNYNKQFVLNGNDYPTKDGTCVRDYIHVQDIVNAHVLAIENQVTGTYNLGSGFGFSNLDCIKAVCDYYDTDIGVDIGPRRSGDIPAMIADATKAKAVFGWTTQHDIKDVVKSLDLWYNSELFNQYKDKQDEQMGYR